MSDLDWLRHAAATDERPPPMERDELPRGQAPQCRAAAGYALAVNKITDALYADNLAAWQRRHGLYAAEIARLKTQGGTIDPAFIERLHSEIEWAAMKADRFADFNTTAGQGHRRIRELLSTLNNEMWQRAAATASLRQAAADRIDILNNVAAVVDEINAMTQRVLDEYGPKTLVADFLASHNLDTTVPPY
ncbi:MAG: hypothetical protein QJR12_03710 [Mycobacterium sp.]|uniref:hypothetical protein n=1 Tax=Mycobacterium sp. TaxID=1785 RepID=UPI002609B8BC|nr:hypothetical protein [Mycobacterium sp.]MDI3313412.1 hypothetical protein [Mycobacterium sp.]